jgi:hypothetical protein
MIVEATSGAFQAWVEEMNIFRKLAESERRWGPIALQLFLVVASAIGLAYFAGTNIVMVLFFPVAIGWYFNANEVHRLVLIPLWIILAFAVGGTLD